MLPQDGGTNISTTATLIVVFSLPVDLSSAQANIQVVDEQSNPMPLPPATIVGGAGTTATNTVSIDLGSGSASTSGYELGSMSHYRLIAHRGISADQSIWANPTDTDVISHFQTGAGSNYVNAATVTNVLVDRVSDSRAELTWSLPSGTSAALVLRKSGAVITERPVTGWTYLAGQMIDGAEVVGIAPNRIISENLTPDVPYDWAIFTVDPATNVYGEIARVPFIANASLLWCPVADGAAAGTESGTFTVSSPDTGNAALLVMPVGASSYARVPSATSVTLGTAATFATPDVTAGTTYWQRYSASNEVGEQRTAPATFVASSTALAESTHPLEQPGSVGLNGTATFGFFPFAWLDFEVGADTDDVVPVPLPVKSLNLPLHGAVQAIMANAGHFRLRTRPVVPGCSPAAWVSSQTFAVGSVFYVSASTGSDTNDGLSRTTPFLTLAKALSTPSTKPLDVLIAQGTYPEGINLPSSVRLFGGYAADFQSRDPGPRTGPAAHETIFTGTVNVRGSVMSPAALYAGTHVTGASVDGLTLAPLPTSPSAEWIYGVYLDNDWSSGGTANSGAAIALTNNRIYSAKVSSGQNFEYAVYSTCEAPQILDGNEIYGLGTTSATEDYGVLIHCGPYPPSIITVTNNLIRATNALRFDGGYAAATGLRDRLVMYGNTITGRVDAAAPTTTSVTAFTCTGGEMEVHGNLFSPDRMPSSIINYTTTGADIDNACFGDFYANRVEGGRNCWTSRGMSVASSPPSGHPIDDA